MSKLGEFTAKEVCKLLRLEYSKLDYWARSGFFVPSVSKANGSGSKRLYSFLDLVTLKVIKELRDAGVTVPKLKKVIQYMLDNGKDVENPFAGSVLITDGKKVFELTAEKETVVDILNNGQLMWVICLGKLVKKLKNQVIKMEKNWGEEEDFKIQKKVG